MAFTRELAQAEYLSERARNMNKYIRHSSAPFWSALLMLMTGMVVMASPTIRTVRLEPGLGITKRHGPRRMHGVMAPAGGSGFTISAPVSIINAGGVPLGIYANPQDANSFDGVGNHG